MMTLEQMILTAVRDGWKVTFAPFSLGSGGDGVSVNVSKKVSHGLAHPLEAESFQKIVSGFEKWADKHIGN